MREKMSQIFQTLTLSVDNTIGDCNWLAINPKFKQSTKSNFRPAKMSSIKCFYTNIRKFKN